jgi:asparaginyl-tRNA synthetase
MAESDPNEFLLPPDLMSETRKLDVRQARDPALAGQSVRIMGWVRTRRDSKAGFSFVEVNDGSCLGNLQVIAGQDLENYESVVKLLTAGCSISVEGELKLSGGAGQATEVAASRIELMGGADPDQYPLQAKRHSLEKLREWAHLRPRTNTIGAVARVRNCICNSIHQFFQEQGFLYLHTPVITTSDCEGAGEMFQVTTLDLPALGKRTVENINWKYDFFKRPAWLTVSGQLEAETYACAMGRVYTFGPTFRAEKSNTSRHLAEFWMIEPEMAFYDLDDNMDLAERFLKRIFSDALSRCGEEMQFFSDRPWDKNPDTEAVGTVLERIVDSEFRRVSYSEAIEILKSSGMAFEYPVEWGSDLQSEHERFLTEQHFRSPVILFNYPRTIKPFYMYCNDDGKTVRGMDVLVPQIGEIIGGSQREHRLETLLARMAEQNLDAADYWWYTDLRRFGTVPHSGFGLGLERVVQFVTGMNNIRDVIPFPRFPGNAEF